MANPPPGPRAKIKWAKKHLVDLANQREAFLHKKPEPIRLVGKVESDGEFVVRMKVQEGIPDDIPLILGDLVHNLRSALDILMCDLVRHRGRKVRPRTGFPIVDDPEKVKSAIRTKVRGAGSAVKEAVERLDPYKGADNLLWVLHDLDIADKHNLLLTVAMASSGGINIGPMANTQLQRAMAEAGMTAEVAVPDIFVRPASIDCYKDGDVVVRYPSKPKDHQDIEYGFGIAINQPGIVECEPIIPFAKELIDFVDGVIPTFDKYFV